MEGLNSDIVSTPVIYYPDYLAGSVTPARPWPLMPREGINLPEVNKRLEDLTPPPPDYEDDWEEARRQTQLVEREIIRFERSKEHQPANPLAYWHRRHELVEQIYILVRAQQYKPLVQLWIEDPETLPNDLNTGSSPKQKIEDKPDKRVILEADKDERDINTESPFKRMKFEEELYHQRFMKKHLLPESELPPTLSTTSHTLPQILEPTNSDNLSNSPILQSTPQQPILSPTPTRPSTNQKSTQQLRLSMGPDRTPDEIAYRNWFIKMMFAKDDSPVELLTSSHIVSRPPPQL